MRKIQLFLIPILLLAFVGVNGQSIIYVKASSMSLGNGTSWSKPYPNLQIAIDNASSGDTIWVAKGTYKPTKSYNSSSDVRTKSFILTDDIKIFGGFQGTETSLSQRVLSSSTPTILSGDIGTAKDSSDNVYHVVLGLNVNNVLFDGITISYGNADTTLLDTVGNNVVSRAHGGGLYLDSSTFKLNQVQIEMNYAKVGGAGINLEVSKGGISNSGFSANIINGNGYDDSKGGGGAGIRNKNSNPSIINTFFELNKTMSVQGGGAMRNVNSNPSIDSCSFSKNHVDGGDGGGAVYNLSSNPTFRNVRIDSNSTNGEAGGVYSDSSDPTFIGVVFESNSGGTGGGGAMENDAGTATFNNVTFSNNSSLGDGGAIQNWKSSIDLTDVTFENNQADGNGGAIVNYNTSSPTMNRVTFNGNSTKGNGGAIYNERNSNSVITNALIYNNHAGEKGGGIYTIGGTNASSVILTNVTITKNNADTSGGGGFDDGAGNTQLRNTIIYGNKAPNFDEVEAPISMIATSISNSIIGDERYIDGMTPPIVFTSIHFMDSLNNDFRLDTLSPGIDNGDSAVYIATATPNLSSITTDIRGMARNRGVNVDIGAYENCTSISEGTIHNVSYTEIGNVFTFTALANNAGQNPDYKWYVNNVLVPGVTGNQYIATVGIDIFNNDWVAVGIYPTEPCINGGSQDSIQVVITGLDKNTETNNQFSIFPNPNNGSFTLAINSEKAEVLSYSITDITGKELYRKENQSSDAQLQKTIQLDLSNGLYFLTVTNQKGERKSLKFMVGR